jgi:uncharacterized protein
VAAYFLDTSALVKRYAKETGTAWVQSLTAPTAGHSLSIVRIALVETVAAITRQERGGSMSAQAAATALTDFRLDFARQYFVLDVSAELIDYAAMIARAHGLRGYDAVQLAAALQIRTHAPSLTMLYADQDLNAAATAEGLPVDDPNNHP